MNDKRGYSVIKFVSDKERCYKGIDYVEGQLLARYLKKYPNIAKEQLLLWMREIIRQLAEFHKLGSQACYRYVNPYMIVVSAERLPLLVDTKAEESYEMIRMMEREEFRRHFIPSDLPYDQQADLAFDLYGLGKSMQYILAHSAPQPELTGREIHQFRKVIKKCLRLHSKKSYQSISAILKEFPKIRKTNK